MRMTEIIAKKRDGNALTEEEITFFISGCVSGGIPDYQTSALLMAIYFNGMNEQETAVLTQRMASSGSRMDLSAIDGVKVDKHSTGGVGDKTSLICGPIAAACGVKVAKMSGKGLGHTGGTIDKLLSIPHMRTELAPEEFFKAVQKNNISMISQSGNLAPADKKLYALRDVTATVESLPLIASSIMSKKLAAGSDCIVLDVKTGSGAFMKTLDDSLALAEAMVKIGEASGKKTVALITDMNVPLGHAVGNSLEVMEAADILKGKGPADLKEVSLSLAAEMIYLAGGGSLKECRQKAEEAISSGAALEKFRQMILSQGGDASVLEDYGKFKQPKYIRTIPAPTNGYLTKVETERLGHLSVILGAGRTMKDDPIDYSAGILLKAGFGDYVQKGVPLAVLYSDKESELDEAEALFPSTVLLGNQKPSPPKLVLARVEKDRISRF